MNKLFTKIAALFLGATMAVGVGVAVGTSGKSAEQVSAATNVASFSRSGTTDNATGGTFSSTFSGQSGYYQDGSGARYMQILNNSAYWTTTPSSIELTSKIGGGSGNTDLTNSVNVVLLDSNGNEISSTNTEITSHITTAGGDTYNTTIPNANNVYGVKISHTKQSGFNVRYYSFTLSYESGGGASVTVSVNPESLSLDLNGTKTGSITATATTSGTATAGLTAESSDPTVASISTDTPTSGTAFTVTGNAVGTATITVTSAWDDTKSATCEVTVSSNVPIPTGNGVWKETAITSLTDTDTFVIVGIKNSNYYAMYNNNGASAAPTAVSVTVSDGKITSEVAETIMWNISGGTSPYTFYKAGDNSKWLYCTSANDGVRVGTNVNKTFTISNEGYLFHGGTSRYVGVYTTNPDWRCYTSIGSNIQNETFKFYKFVKTYAVTKNATNCVIAGETSIDASSNASYTITPNTNYNAPTSITVKRGSATLVQGTDYSYSISNNVGSLTIYKAAITGDLSITAAGIPTYQVTGSITNGSLTVPGRIVSGGVLDVTIVPESGYGYPESENDITVTNATIASYNNESGVIRLSSPSGNVTVTATCPALGKTFTIDVTVSNGESSGDTTITDHGGVASVTITPTGDYKLPTSVSVSGADHTYNSSTGVISLSNATGDEVETTKVLVTANMVPLTPYTINVSADGAEYTGDTVIKESRTATITFTPTGDKGQPAEVTVSGATQSWNRSTGVLTLSNPTSDPVEVTYVATDNELTGITLSKQKGDYILGDPLDDSIVVTAHYSVTGDKTVTPTNVSGYDPYTTGDQTVTFKYNDGVNEESATYTASVSAASYPETVTWTKITSASDLSVGDQIVIVADSADKALGTTQNNNNRSATNITKSGSNVTWTGNDVQVLTLVSTSGVDDAPSGSFGLSPSEGQYLYAASSGSNHLKTQSTLDLDGCFVITVDNGISTIDATESSNRSLMQYNSGSTIFSCYGSAQSNGDLLVYKKYTESSGTAKLIRIVCDPTIDPATGYKGGEKFVGDKIHTTDFVVKKQLDTGTELTAINGFTINGGTEVTLNSTSNTITISYTENNIPKTTTIVVPATERTVELESIVLVQGEGVVKNYIDWSGAEWNYTGLTIDRIWSDETVEHLSLADLVSSGDATISPAKPSIGVTSFTVSYEYLEVKISDATVSEINVRSDYVTSIAWNGTTASHFKAFSGGQLTAAQVAAWSVVPTFAGAGVQSALSFNQYTLKVGDKTISSLPYTWVSEDDGKELSITYGKDVDGNDFVKKNATAKGNICATINAIDHDETTTGEQTLSNFYDGMVIDTEGTSGGGAACEAHNGTFVFESDNGYAQESQIRSYKSSTFTISSSYTIKTINFTFSGSYNGGLETSYTNINATSKTFAELGSQARITNIEIVYEGEVTTTVHYANQMEHFEAQKAVVKFAKAFNAAMDETENCTTGLSTAWAACELAYNNPNYESTKTAPGFLQDISSLSETEQDWAKNMLNYATKAWSDDSEPACVERMMKTYQVCVQKHEMTPFMSDFITLGSGRMISPISTITNNTESIAIIAVISIVSLSAIGGYFFLRKRREQN